MDYWNNDQIYMICHMDSQVLYEDIDKQEVHDTNKLF